MNFFRQIVNKLFLFCKLKKPVETKENKSTKKCSIILCLDENNKTNIEVEYDTSIENTADLIYLSEKFAEMIIYLGSSSFKKTLFYQLIDRQKKSDDISEQIFIDNVIGFYDIIKQEISLSNKSKQPVVRPLSVFNVK